MPGLGSKEDLTDEQKAILNKVLGRFTASDRLHRSLRERWNVWYGLSRNYRRLQQVHAQAGTPNDRDVVIQALRREWGDELFIPYTFATIETVLPRVLSTDPTMNVKPNDDKEETYLACEPVKRLFERDQAAIGYELKLQETVRSGLRYGLGVQKTFWEKRFRSGKAVVSKESEDGYKLVDKDKILVYQGPMAESADIYDFFWDPVGKDLPSCGYLLHRTWRNMEYIEQRVIEGRERRAKGENGGWVELDMEKVKGLGSNTGRGEVWADRMTAAGMSDYETEGNTLHEVWEYHDRERVYTILDRTLVVQDSANPFLHGDFPFAIYRPTLVEQEFCGIGEAEPIAHLQYELNKMRGQRRDAATLALNRGYFYPMGMLDPATVVSGAGVYVPVQGDPAEIVPMPFTDIPASGVAEEQALKRDIELTTGISDPVTGAGDSETATGTQLVQAAAGLRIAQKAKNVYPDLLRPSTAQWRELYRANLTEERQTQTIRISDESTPRGYSFVKAGPKQINANLDIKPTDGSTEPDDIAQKRADAVQLTQALAGFVDVLEVPKLIKHVLIQFGVDQPDEWVKPPGPEPEQVVEAIGQTLLEAGLPEEQISEVLESALQRVQEAPPPESSDKPAAPEGGAPEPVGAGA